MRLLALDLATRLGFAYGDSARGNPVAGWHQLPRTGDDIGAYAAAYHDWLRGMVAEAQPEMITFEEPIPTQAGRTTQTTAIKLTGLCWHTEFFAKMKNIRCTQVHGNTWKKALTGSGKANKRMNPYPVLTACRQRGWDVTDDNAADACGVWYYAASLVSPAEIGRFDPLFMVAAE